MTTQSPVDTAAAQLPEEVEKRYDKVLVEWNNESMKRFIAQELQSLKQKHEAEVRELQLGVQVILDHIDDSEEALGAQLRWNRLKESLTTSKEQT